MSAYHRTLVQMHASHIVAAGEMEARAHRVRRLDRDEASLLDDQAAEQRDRAMALASALRDLGADVHFPNPAQMSLLSDGGPL